MLFSVYIPVYNAKKYIGEAIESVLNQDFCDYELIIINDGSTDRSGEIIAEYAEKDQRIRVIDQLNKGLFHTRIEAFRAANGEYVIALDADDALKPTALSTIKHAIDENDGVDLIMFRYERFADNRVLNEGRKVFADKELFVKENIDQLYRKVLSSDHLNAVCFKAIRTACLQDYAHIEALPRISVAEDRIHTLNFLPKVKKAIYLQDVLYSYRYTKNSMTNLFDQTVLAGNQIVSDEMVRFANALELKEMGSVIARYEQIKICKLLVYSPSRTRLNRKAYKAYWEMVTPLCEKDIIQTGKTQGLSMLYKLPLFLVKHHKIGVLFFLKYVVSKARYIKDLI